MIETDAFFYRNKIFKKYFGVVGRVQTDSFVNNELLDPEELTNTGNQSNLLGNLTTNSMTDSLKCSLPE